MNAFPKQNLDKVAVTFDLKRDRTALPPAHSERRPGRAPGNSLPDWQIERGRILHRACKSVELRIAHGEKPRRAFWAVAYYRAGQTFKSDPRRRLVLSEKSLRGYWRQWRRGGEVPAAFASNCIRRPRPADVPAPVLARFAEYCSSKKFPSMKAAWAEWSGRAGNKRARLNQTAFESVRYFFPASIFDAMQRQLKTVHAARTALGALKLQAVALIRSRVPDRLPRVRVNRELNFEI